MKRILVSWIATYYDFIKESGEVQHTGPTYHCHETFYDSEVYEKHLLLSSSKGKDDDNNGLKAELLANELRVFFPSHSVELVHMGIANILDFQEIKYRVESVLQEYEGWEIDVLFSTGTTPMRMTWVLLHLEDNDLKINLVQGVDQLMGMGKARFERIIINRSEVSYRLLVSRNTSPSPTRYMGPTLQRVYDQASKLAAHGDLRCLIQGESGSGKELLARFIHDQSPRHNRKFTAINCASIPENLLESTLFGYKKGAFTSAESDTPGLFKEAHGGTLFLDEIGDISPKLQQSLLRVIEKGEFFPIGSNKAEKVNVRIVAATHRDLWEMCNEGSFRMDLFFRLNEVGLNLPAIRDYPKSERLDLIRFFLKNEATRFKLMPLRLSPEVEQLLLYHRYQGNIRELLNYIAHFYVYADRVVMLKDMPDFFSKIQMTDYTLETAKRRHIQEVYEMTGRNLAQTKKLLKTAINTIKKYLGMPGAEQPAVENDDPEE